MGSRIVRILTDSTPLDIKTTKLKQLFLKDTTFFRRKLRHKQLVGIAGITRIAATVFHIAHNLQELGTGNIQRLTQVERIEILDFLRNNRNVVCRLIEYQQFPGPVVNRSTRRILDFIQKSITVSILLIVICCDLQYEKPYQINQDNRQGNASDNKFTFL